MLFSIHLTVSDRQKNKVTIPILSHLRDQIIPTNNTVTGGFLNLLED